MAEKRENDEKKPFMVHCGDCRHEWAAAYYPMDAKAFAEIAMSNTKRCPKCGSRKVYCGRVAGNSSSVTAIIEERPSPLSSGGGA